MGDETVFAPSSPTAIPPGTRLNNTFEIVRMIGAGGVGQVYQGFNIFTRGVVAVKVILPNILRDDEAMMLFRREAEILSTLNHEAIVRYLTYSYDPVLQREYLVMELVEGDSLKKRLAYGRLSLEETMQLRARVAGGLEAAHQRGIVHRDISPDNIMLPAGDVRSAKIIDFGIGKAKDARNETIVRGGFAGKYLYVSPEQVSSGDVTFKSDIYSLGLVLAGALRGRPIDMGASIADVVDKRRRVPDLSDIDAKIRPLLSSMLQPSPRDRPASMAAVAAWPEGVKMGLGDATQEPGRPTASQGRGERIAAAIGALVILVSIGATAFVFRSDIADLIEAHLPKSNETTVASAPPTDAVKAPPTAATPPEAVAPPQATAPLGTVSERPPPAQPAKDAGNVEVAVAPPQQSVATTAAPIASQSPVPAPGSSPGDAGSVVSELLELYKPGAPQEFPSLPLGFVGAPYHAELPAFIASDPTRLRLTAQPPPPPGLEFRDTGKGVGVIEGTPRASGSATLEVTATSDKGQSATMDVVIVVAAATLVDTPSSPTEAKPSSVALEGAWVGEDYNATLPQMGAKDGAGPPRLRVDPVLPPGLSLVETGPGAPRLSGRPTQPGSFKFDLIGPEMGSAAGHTTVTLEVASAAGASTIDRPTRFLHGYDGGVCVFARALAEPINDKNVEVIGADADVFARFAADFRRAVGGDPRMLQQAIDRQECSTLQLLKVAQPDGLVAAPRIALESRTVGPSAPLAGRISGLAGRTLKLLVVKNDGATIVMPATPASADIATFRQVFKGIGPEDVGHTLAVIAIVSDKPLNALAELGAPRAGEMGRVQANELVGKLLTEWAGAGAAADVQFATLAH